MTFTQFSLGALALLPLLAAALTMLLPHPVRRALGVLVALLVAGFTAPVLGSVTSGELTELVLGGFDAPLGIHLRGDGLAAVFLGVTSLVGVVVTGYAAVLPKSTGAHLSATSWVTSHPGFWPLWLGCWSGLNAVYLSGDLFNLYVSLELVGLTAVALVAVGGQSAWEPALRYLFIAVLGSLMFLAGVGLLAAVTGTLDLHQTRSQLDELEDPTLPLLALTLITVGLAMKVALLPMHRWLVPAHSAAPSAVSPILSGVVIKAALVVLLRCWLWALPAVPGMQWLAWLLGGLGVAAVLVGSVLALRQDRLKPLVAYSTVAQIGYWFVAFPLLLHGEHDGAPLGSGAYNGLVALAAGHAIAKAGLFTAAGFLKDRCGTDKMSALRGAGAHHPVLILAMGMCAVGLLGLPISLGFTGKWQLATAAVGAEQWWVLLVVAAGTLLSAAYLLRGIAPLLLQAEVPENAPAAGPVRGRERLGEIAVLIFGVATIGTGLLGAWLGDLLEVGAWW
ncbi:complex I subunit 5 family protein [Nesterenkonia sphaerica]|uniref:Oxidoreductase n=1 Tax=Nesterenkonia sphaerica TaxID=1804988 RepID=A0A5R9AMI2_9MICC|nr:proton-conducting transporter membrane subunit [Nesterenkonia sphaerica]TLP79847.1 oxidoreductase [Nesterenkonia sphaerica]